MNNTVILVGRLTKSPEIRYTKNEKAVCEFTLAVDRQGRDGADFIRVQSWNKIAEAINKYCQQGDMIGVRGNWTHDTYEDKDGNKRYKDYVTLENVTFLANKRKEEPKEKLNCVETMEAITKNPFEEFAEETQDDLPF